MKQNRVWIGANGPCRLMGDNRSCLEAMLFRASGGWKRG